MDRLSQSKQLSLYPVGHRMTGTACITVRILEDLAVLFPSTFPFSRPYSMVKTATGLVENIWSSSEAIRVLAANVSKLLIVVGVVSLSVSMATLVLSSIETTKISTGGRRGDLGSKVNDGMTRYAQPSSDVGIRRTVTSPARMT